MRRHCRPPRLSRLPTAARARLQARKAGPARDPGLLQRASAGSARRPGRGAPCGARRVGAMAACRPHVPQHPLRASLCERAWRPDAQRRQSRNTEPSAMIFLGKRSAVGKAVHDNRADARHRPSPRRRDGVTFLPQFAGDDGGGFKRRFSSSRFFIVYHQRLTGPLDTRHHMVIHHRPGKVKRYSTLPWTHGVPSLFYGVSLVISWR
jgi:hypothetical protein